MYVSILAPFFLSTELYGGEKLGAVLDTQLRLQTAYALAKCGILYFHLGCYIFSCHRGSEQSYDMSLIVCQLELTRTPADDVLPFAVTASQWAAHIFDVDGITLNVELEDVIIAEVASDES